MFKNIVFNPAAFIETLPYMGKGMLGIFIVIAIIVVKQLFGGIGYNFANPAITARVIMLISFGIEMTTYVSVDAVSHATPLSGGNPGLMNMLIGMRGGALGETCALALLAGGFYLMARKVITWHIPVAYIGTVAIVSLLTGQDIVVQVFGGGLMLGAFFMATDCNTSPLATSG